MPAHLRPTAPFAADAILVGDPGRALLLAQVLLTKPKMSNHARGLWGYTGPTADGGELTIQATGIGGPSAAAVLADLAAQGVRRVVRVGTCTALDPSLEAGELLLTSAALATPGSAASFGVAAGEKARPDPSLQGGLAAELGEGARAAIVASLDSLPAGDSGLGGGAAGAAETVDMQTVAVLGRARQLEIAAAAVLIVSESATGETLDDEELAERAARAGKAAAAALSNPKVEG